MKLSEKGLDLIKEFEGFHPNVYVCPAGYKTIGFGHLLKPGEDFSGGLSLFEGERLLYQDTLIAQAAVRRLINVPLNQNQFDVLVSFTFNLGAGALQRSTLRRIVNRQEHNRVPTELLKWVRAGGRKLNGLVRRRQAEGELYQP